jgi:hypothetical protein
MTFQIACNHVSVSIDNYDSCWYEFRFRFKGDTFADVASEHILRCDLLGEMIP